MFKVGDKVKCIDDAMHGYIVCGLIYEVVAISQLGVQVSNGHAYHYPAQLFEKVNEMTIEINPKAKSKKTDKSQANLFYVRRVGMVTETVVHKTFEDARNEANRLAEGSPNHEFHVLAVTYTVKKVPVYTTETQEYHV